MAPSFECVPTLLCAEDNNSVMGWDDEVVGESFREEPRPGGGSAMDLPPCSDEFIEALVSNEREYLPQGDYASRFQSGVLDVSIRRDAIEWIWKVHAHYNFVPLTAYLTVNYLDRFLSCYELPQGKAWMMQLLSVACLSLAAKMEETDVPLSIDLQVGEAKFIFEARTIQRMELLVLSTLKWKMRAVTPLSFLDHFLRQINGGNPPSPPSMTRSMELILSTTRGINFLEFRPSVVAAAVVISVSEENETVDFDKAMSHFPLVEKESVLRCYEMIQETFVLRIPSGCKEDLLGSVQSPNGVLEATCWSYKSDETNHGSCAQSCFTSPVAKRRKLDSFAAGGSWGNHKCGT
ncbi:cyclin-D4-1-like [Nymphaea colorata]|nr:cyclin-D4-1-like [Nymphaea colorata]